MSAGSRLRAHALLSLLYVCSGLLGHPRCRGCLSSRTVLVPHASAGQNWEPPTSLPPSRPPSRLPSRMPSGSLRTGGGGNGIHATSVTDLNFMRQALEEAQKAGARGEVPIGAIMVDADGKTVSHAPKQTNQTGYHSLRAANTPPSACKVARSHNLVARDNDPTAHAEMLAIREATSRLGNWRLNNCTLYCTLEPCAMCLGNASNARGRCSRHRHHCQRRQRHLHRQRLDLRRCHLPHTAYYLPSTIYHLPPTTDATATATATAASAVARTRCDPVGACWAGGVCGT